MFVKTAIPSYYDIYTGFKPMNWNESTTPFPSHLAGRNDGCWFPILLYRLSLGPTYQRWILIMGNRKKWCWSVPPLTRLKKEGPSRNGRNGSISYCLFKWEWWRVDPRSHKPFCSFACFHVHALPLLLAVGTTSSKGGLLNSYTSLFII